MSKKLRLLKIIVQPIFVVDDGDTLTEQPAQPITVAAADWNEFIAHGLADSIEELRQRVEGEDAG